MFEDERIEAIREMGAEGADEEKKIGCMNVLVLYVGDRELREKWVDYDAISAICDIALSGSDSVKEEALKTIKDRCDTVLDEVASEEVIDEEAHGL